MYGTLLMVWFGELFVVVEQGVRRMCFITRCPSCRSVQRTPSCTIFTLMSERSANSHILFLTTIVLAADNAEVNIQKEELFFSQHNFGGNVTCTLFHYFMRPIVEEVVVCLQSGFKANFRSFTLIQFSFRFWRLPTLFYN